MKNKLAKTTAIIGLALGSGFIGYAASNAFQDLDTIRGELRHSLAIWPNEIAAQVRTRITAIQQHSYTRPAESRNRANQIRQAKEIEAKQREIEAKQQEIATKQQEADSLRQQLSTMQNDKGATRTACE